MTIVLPGRLVLVGAGKMGGAMLEGWLANGVNPDQVEILDPQPPPEMAELIATRGLSHNGDIAGMVDVAVVVLAVKPQVMDAVLPQIVPLARQSPVFLSVAAGRTIAGFERHFGPESAVVRAMPNTPAAIGRGITVACPNAHVARGPRALCTDLLAAVGEVGWVEDESLLDAVTGVSGSGPAYVFHLTECLADAGVDAGLDRDLATRLARATVAGAGELMRQSGLPAATLRENVTSPAGTTAAALEVLRSSGRLKALMSEAVAAATERSRELAG